MTLSGGPAVAHSVLCPDSLGPLVEEAYALPERPACFLLARRLSHTYGVQTSTGSFVLRVWRKGWRTVEEIRSELLLLQHCAQQDAPVSPPLCRRDGGLVTPLEAPEGRRYAALFRRAPGVSLEEATSSAAASALGHATAEVHAACNRYAGPFTRPTLDADHLFLEPLRRLARARPEWAREITAVRDLGPQLAARLAAFPRESPFYGICHGDISPSNAHITAAGRVEIFDFDLCGVGWRALDLASFLWETERAGWTQPAREAFLAGYEEVRPLAAWERNSISVFVALCNVAFLGLRAALADECGREALSDRLLLHYFEKTRKSVLELDSGE